MDTSARPRPRQYEFEVVVYTWVAVGRRETLRTRTSYFLTLAEAKASLKGITFFEAKILHHGELVYAVRGKQPNPFS